METTAYNSAETPQNMHLIEELLVKHLGLSKEEAARIIVIIGGDQSTVEKVRTVKKYLATCSHGFARFGWILPLVQIWHMGWADLERILDTHWGNDKDSASYKLANAWLEGDVKNAKRPDYYPAQRLVFDTLKADVIECFRYGGLYARIQQLISCSILLEVDDLAEHFKAATDAECSVEAILPVAEMLVQRYMSTQGSNIARSGGQLAEDIFPVGDEWVRATHQPKSKKGKKKGKAKAKSSGAQDSFHGDLTLANIILRMRDSMLHYTFHYATATGDIGVVMEVMNVRRIFHTTNLLY